MTIGKRQDIAFFLSFCIEQYKTRKGMTGTQAMTELRSYGVLDYLCDNYEALLSYGACATGTQIYGSTGDQNMNLNVTQENLYLLIPSKVGRVAEMMTADGGQRLVEAIEEIYVSGMYQRLEKEDTKTWHLGPVALLQEMSAERHAEITQGRL